MSLESLALQTTLLSIMFRFMFNLLILFILIRLIYYRFSRKEEYVFTYFMMGMVIFLLCSLLGTVDIQIGMALGLFAIFAILRFRTVNFSVKDMTYIFVVIGISVINSQANIPPPVIGAIVVNFVILGATLILELFYLKNSLSSYVVKYNKPELLAPGRKTELLEDLSRITGLTVVRVSIHELDVTKNNCEVEIWYKA
jgi:Domain of unknown function (DUF4956)